MWLPIYGRGCCFSAQVEGPRGHGATLGTTSAVHVHLTRIFSPKPENYYIIILTLRYYRVKHLTPWRIHDSTTSPEDGSTAGS